MTVGALLDHLQRGDVVYCPQCGSELIAAIDNETAAKLRVHPGIYCLQDSDHVRVYVDSHPAPEFWDQFKK